MDEQQQSDAAQKPGEELRPGETASIQNQSGVDVAVSLRMGDGGRLELQLAPQQVLELCAGESGARVVLRSGKPEDLLVVKPSTP